MADRPRALVTAPFRGEGMATLQSLADVVYDPWIEQVPLRLYNGEKLAARIEAEGANLLIVESDSVKGPVFDLPLVCIGSCRGDPNNVDIPAATAAGIPVLRAPGRNAERGRGDHHRVDVRGEPLARPRRSRRARGRGLRGRQDPLPALPGVGAQRPDRRHRRPRCGRARREVAFRRPRHARALVRSVQPRGNAQRPISIRCSTNATSCRCTRWSPPRPKASSARRSSRR